MSGIVTELVIIAVLLVVNGIFAMSELAIVAAKRVRLERQAERGDAGAAAALALAANPSEFLSTVQVGITLVGVIASAYGGATIAEQLSARFQTIDWLAPRAEAAALTVVVAGITYLSVIVGELVPKRIALGNPERVASFVARPMSLLSRIGYPLVRLLTLSSQLVLRVFGIKGLPAPGLTEEEIHAVIEQGAETGVVPAMEHAIVENVFRLGDRAVSAIMTPRLDVEWVDATASLDEIRAASVKREWVLVCNGDLEHTVGSIHASDLLAQCLAGQPLSLQSNLREALFIPMSTPVFRLLEMFQQPNYDVAMIIDEYGGVAGVATRDDIIAGVLGKAAAPVETPVIVQNSDGSWTADGDMDMRDIEATLDLPHLDTEPRRGYRTIGGFILSHLGRVPQVGDQLRAGMATFSVETMDGRRIDKVRITRDTPPRKRRSRASGKTPAED